MIKQEALPGTGEEGEGKHDSGRIKHIFLVSDFRDKRVPGFLSKVRNINLTCKGFCGQWKSWCGRSRSVQTNTHKVKAIEHHPTPLHPAVSACLGCL